MTLACLEAVLRLARETTPDIGFINVGVDASHVLEGNCGHGSLSPTELVDAAALARRAGGTGAIRCDVAPGVPGTASDWPMFRIPNCTASPDVNLAPLHWCNRQRFSRPFEDCSRVPAVSISDALWPVSRHPWFEAQLSPTPCTCNNCPGTYKWNLPEPPEKIFSGDNSGHLGGGGNRILAASMGVMVAQALWELGLVAGSPNHVSGNQVAACVAEGGELKQPLPVPWGHFIQRSELRAIQSTLTLVPLHSGSHIGDGWALCESIWPAVCPGYGRWVHRAQGKYKGWHDKVTANVNATGDETLRWTVQIPADPERAPYGFSLSLGYIKSGFEPYGRFVVTTEGTGQAQGDQGNHSVSIDSSAAAHTVEQRQVIANNLGLTTKATTYIITITPLPHDSSHGPEATQVEILSKLLAVPSSTQKEAPRKRP